MKRIEKIAKALLIFSLAGLLTAWYFPEPASGAVTVTAQVVEGVITCTTDLTATAFGSIDNSSVYTAGDNSTTTVSSNGSIYVKAISVGDSTNPGLATTSPAHLIPSPDAAYSETAELAAGTEGYGIQATTTGTITIATRYLQIGNYVGGLASTSAAVVASSSAAVTDEVVEIIYKAAVASDTPAGSYEDTVTISCSTS